MLSVGDWYRCYDISSIFKINFHWSFSIKVRTTLTAATLKKIVRIKLWNFWWYIHRQILIFEFWFEPWTRVLTRFLWLILILALNTYFDSIFMTCFDFSIEHMFWFEPWTHVLIWALNTCFDLSLEHVFWLEHWTRVLIRYLTLYLFEPWTHVLIWF